MIQTKAGGMYVAVAPDDPDTGKPDKDADKVLHEVRNLASARLIAGKPDNPTTVGTDDLAAYTRGPQMGIDGAPNNLDTYPSDRGSYWGLCDWRDTRSNLSLTNSKNLTTTVVAGDLWSGGNVLSRTDGLLVRPADEQSTLYLVFGDRKAKIDPDDTAVLDALDIGSEDVGNAQVVSRGVLNSIPASPDMLAPNLNRSGETSTAVPERSVGDVLRTRSADGSDKFYAVLDAGVQSIPQVVADLLVNHGGSASSADSVSGYPQDDEIDLTAFPNSTPKLHTPASVCMAWKRADGSNTPETRVLYADNLPVEKAANDQAVTTLPLADGSAPVADRVVTRPGRGWLAQVTGNGRSGADEKGQLMYVSDAGVRYDLGVDKESNSSDSDKGGSSGVDATRKALGLTDAPVLIPDGVARMLPKGPDLSREAAMVETVGVSDAPAEAGAGKTDGEPEQHRQAPATQTQDNGADAVAPRESEVADRAREIAEEYGTSEAPSSSSAPPKPGEPAGEASSAAEPSEAPAT
jgi:type VII secretion protein EccB